jgi:hypothetical protein
MDKVSLGCFGDERLAARGAALLAAVESKRTLCLHRLGDDRNQTLSFGAFLANPAVSAHEMMVTAGQRTDRQAAGRHVLAIMDTTEISFPTQTDRKRGFGTGGNGSDIGLFLHPVLAVDAGSGGILGLVDCTAINRTEGKAADRKQRPADEKESRRWLDGAEIAGDRLTQAATITVVADRESDIYDLFARKPDNVHLLCRSAQPRLLTTGGLLPEHCTSLPERDRSRIEVPAKGNRPARQATVALRFGPISLQRPSRPGAKGLPEAVALSVVDVQEVDPPAGAEPVCWRLLTTHPVATLAEARQIVAWYRRRWIVEQVFRSMKSHCLDIETSQIETAGCFIKMAAIALIAATRAMQLVLARDGTTEQPIADAADPADLPALRALNTSLEGRTEKLKNPNSETTLAWFVWIVARLGGWSGYTSKGYKPPGPKTMHHGLQRLDPILTGWRLASHSAHV